MRGKSNFKAFIQALALVAALVLTIIVSADLVLASEPNGNMSTVSCRTVLKTPSISKYRGYSWRAEKVEPGKFGGFIVRAKYDPRVGDLQWSLEGIRSVAIQSLGSDLASFFGHENRDELISFPTAIEANGHFDHFNSLINNSESHPAYFQYRYEIANDTSDETSFSTKLLVDKLVPAAPSGHLFFHDINTHFMFNWIPPKYMKLLEAQEQYLKEFSDWVKKHHPKLFNSRVELMVTSADGKRRIKKSFKIMTAVKRTIFENVDFGMGNFGYSLNRKVVSSAIPYADFYISDKLTPEEKSYFSDYAKHNINSIRQITGDLQLPKDRIMSTILHSRSDHILNILQLMESPNGFIPTETPLMNWVRNEFTITPSDSQIWEDIKQRYRAIEDVVLNHKKAKD